ncbi:hypothetical protein DFH09DRAFT_1307796 [Mycena vulgaris]|nr:hypothetical protein DFH09DRAFT_1307796 [Mycena vulgaris]
MEFMIDVVRAYTDKKQQLPAPVELGVQREQRRDGYGEWNWNEPAAAADPYQYEDDPSKLTSGCRSIARARPGKSSTITLALIATGDALSHDSVGQFCMEATKINDELAALQRDSELLNRFNPMNIVKHRRCLNHAIEFRVRARKELVSSADPSVHCIQGDIDALEDDPFNFPPALRLRRGNPSEKDPGLPDQAIASETFAVEVETEAELSSVLPLYEESATVDLILRPTEWEDDGPSLVRAILDSMPGTADGKQITVGRMDESGMLVPQRRWRVGV